MPANLIVRFPLGLYMLAKKRYMWQDHSLPGAVFRIAHGHLSSRNNGNKRPGVQVFQVMLCTTWWDAFARPWISDPNETMMSCLAWKGCCEANNWQQYVKNQCRNFVTFHSKLQRSISGIIYHSWHNSWSIWCVDATGDFRNIFGIFAEGERSSRKPRKEKSTGDLTKGVSFVRGSTLQPTSVPARCLVSKVVKLKDVMTNSMFHNPIMFQKVLASLKDAIWSDFRASDCWTWTHQTRHRQRKRRKKRKRRMTKMKIPMSIVDLSWMPVYPMAISSQQWRDLNFLLATSCPLTKCQVAMERVLLCCRRWASLVEVLENTMMALPIPSKYRNDKVKELYKMMGRWLTKIFMEMKVGVFRFSIFFAIILIFWGHWSMKLVASGIALASSGGRRTVEELLSIGKAPEKSNEPKISDGWKRDGKPKKPKTVYKTAEENAGRVNLTPLDTGKQNLLKIKDAEKIGGLQHWWSFIWSHCTSEWYDPQTHQFSIVLS